MKLPHLSPQTFAQVGQDIIVISKELDRIMLKSAQYEWRLLPFENVLKLQGKLISSDTWQDLGTWTIL